MTRTTARTAGDSASRGARARAITPELDAAEALSRVHGPLELQAAVLALLVPHGNARAARAWQVETEATPGAARIAELVAQLAAMSRLAWFERLLERLRSQPLAVRQGLLKATRRVMGASDAVRPIDRLHWLAMRRRLGEASGTELAAHPRVAGARAGPFTSTLSPALRLREPMLDAGLGGDLSDLPDSAVRALGIYSAFLSRLVPVEAAEPTEAGTAWYATATSAWRDREALPACRPVDADALVHALYELQALPWMQRPVLVRNWVDAALAHRPHGNARLTDAAADALRLSCGLLDSPLPPGLERHYSGAIAEDGS
ncbi:MAG: hypothetical protein ABIP61_11005 [Burkholderiaceae bacterium]